MKDCKIPVYTFYKMIFNEPLEYILDNSAYQCHVCWQVDLQYPKNLGTEKNPLGM